MSNRAPSRPDLGPYTPGRIPVLWLTLVLLPWAPPAASGQVAPEGVGSRLALKVLLSSEDALSAGSYETNAGVEIETQQLGVRWRLGDHPWRPFVGAFTGRWDERPGSSGSGRDFEALTVGIETGADVLLGGATATRGWFLEPRAALGYSWLELNDGQAEGQADGEAEGEAVTALASLGAGRRWQPRGTWQAEASAAVWWLHTEPGSLDPPLAGDDRTSEHLRLNVSVLLPLSATLSGRGLELAAALSRTELGDDVGEFVASDAITEAALALRVRVGDEHLPVDAVGVALRYFDADAFDGWVLGITVSD